MPDVLIIDESQILGELLGHILQLHGYATAWALPNEARGLLRRTPPALVILEPGPIGSKGWLLLAEMRRAQKTEKAPDVAVLTDHAGKCEVLRAAQLGVRDYMLKKRFSVAELLIRVRRHVAPSQPARSKDEPLKGSRHAPAAPATPKPVADDAATPPAPVPVAVPENRSALPPSVDEEQRTLRNLATELGLKLLTKEQTLTRLETAPVKTLPGVVAELVMQVSSPRGTIADIAGILRHDPVLAARVLRIANSAAFSSNRTRIATVEDAVKNIGVAGVRNLVINVGLFDAFAADSPGGLRVTRVWQHCLGVAMLMEKLAPQDDSIPPGSAYLVGLCHDLAGIVLRQHFPAEYETVSTLMDRSDSRSPAALAVTFGLPYAELVSRLLTHLRLPSVITVPIEEFFDRGDRKGARGAGSLLSRTLRAMNVYAHGLLLASGLDEPITPLTQAECTNTFSNANPPLPDDEAIRGEALATAAVLAHRTEAQTQQMCEPLVPQHPVRVAYCRHAEYSTLDPLWSYLRQGAREVQMLPALHAVDAASLEGAQALIIAGPRTNAAGALCQDLEAVQRLIAGRPIQALYLAGIASPSPADRQVTVQRLPISMEALNDFLARAVPKVKETTAAAAA